VGTTANEGRERSKSHGRKGKEGKVTERGRREEKRKMKKVPGPATEPLYEKRGGSARAPVTPARDRAART
jgi:hypothetical protein